MGYSNLTRYRLFYDAPEIIRDSGMLYERRKETEVCDMYLDSARLLNGFEEEINNSVTSLERDRFFSRFENNMNEVRNLEFVHFIRNYLEKIKIKNERKTELSFRDEFRLLLKAITAYQDTIISDDMFLKLNYQELKKNKIQTFLSYAYYDKGLTTAFFTYFLRQNGFLYVNWMWDGANRKGSITKKVLEEALEDSEQLLFLRTTNSEMRIQGNNQSIRQWCSWEIGNFYTKHNDNKFYTSFYDKAEPKNDLLDSFKAMREVENGIIIPYL